MALDGVFTGGTVSIGAGSTSVTGADTTWLSLNVQPGDLLVVGGMMARIASVTSNTALTLARGWPGGAVSGADYDIYTISETGRALPAMNRIVQDLGSGNISSLAALTGAANKMPYFTGQGVMALADYGNAAGKTVQSGPTDAAQGRVLLNGAHGLGGTLQGASDIDQLFVDGVTGWHRASNGAVGSPADYTNILTVAHYAEIGSQLALGIGNNTPFAALRGKGSAGPAGNWFPFMFRKDIVGTASQSGGVPTGAVIQRGSNGNGEFVRFADGTQICRNYVPSAINANTASGGLFKSDAVYTWTFPATFFGGDGTPVVVGGVRSSAGAWLKGRPTGPATAELEILSAAPLGPNQFIDMVAIGRWF